MPASNLRSLQLYFLIRPGSDLRFWNSTHLKLFQLTFQLSWILFFQLTSKFCDSLFDLGLWYHTVKENKYLQLPAWHRVLELLIAYFSCMWLWCLEYLEWFVNVDIHLQESWAIAKMTARCALCMGALKIFKSPWLRPRLGLLIPKFFMGFCSDRSDECTYKICKFVALPIPEIIGGSQKI